MKRPTVPITKGMKAVYCFLMPFFSLILLSQNTNAQMASSGTFDAKQYNYGYINGSSFKIQTNVPITYSGSLNKLYPETTPPTAKIVINDNVLFDESLTHWLSSGIVIVFINRASIVNLRPH